MVHGRGHRPRDAELSGEILIFVPWAVSRVQNLIKVGIVDMELVGANAHDRPCVGKNSGACASTCRSIPFFSCIFAISNPYRPQQNTS
jgi:hypothetical protein